MAIVRRWNPQVDQAPLAQPRPVQRDTSGIRALAQGVGQVADVVAAADIKATEDARLTREKDAANQLARTRLTLEDAARQAKGKVALEVDLLAGALKGLDDEAEKLAAGISDPKLAERVRLHHQDQRLALEHSIRGHVSKEADAFALQAHKDTVELADLDAQRSAERGDFEGVGAAIERKKGAIAKEAQRLGLGQDWVALETTKELGVLHASVIKTLNGGENPQPRKAARYLDLHRSEIAPALARKIEDELLGDVQEDDGAAAARGFVSSAVNAEGRFDLAAATSAFDAYMKSDASPKARKAAEVEFNSAKVRAAQAFGARVDKAAEDAWTKIANGGYSLRAAQEQLDWLRRPEVGQAEVADKIAMRLTNFLEERSKPGPPTRSQKTAFVDFMLGLPANANRYASNPETFKQEWWGRMGEKDLAHAAQMVAQFGVAARKPDETLPPSVLAAVTALGAQAGKWGKTGPKNDDQKLQFYGLTAALLEEQARLKVAGPVKPDDLVAFARRKLVSGTAFTPAGGEESGVTELDVQNPNVNPGLAGAVFIPDDRRKVYEDRIRREGLPVTKDWLLYFHLSEQPGVDLNSLPFTPEMKAQREGVKKRAEEGKKTYFDPKTGEYTGRTR